MKINHDLFFIPSIMVSIYGFYNIYKLHKKIKEIEQDTEIILKTHNRYMEVQEKQQEAIKEIEQDTEIILKTHNQYMEVQEKQQEAIKDLYNSIEGIACTLPFTSKHEWQNKMIERKFQKELDRHIEIDNQERFETEKMVEQIIKDQRAERKEHACNKEKFFDDESDDEAGV